MTNRKNATSTVNNTVNQASDYAREAADRASEVGDRIESGMKEVAEQLRELDVNEATIPDAFRRVPKTISPKVHAWLDFAVTTYFLGLGVWFAIRGKGGPAIAAFVNGGMVAGVSALTDYDGDGKKPISFKLHGTLDAVQATTAALGPVLHGFAGEPEATYFYGQAANEVAVIATTDWDAGMPAKRRRKAA
jgi:hypothetical protein